MIDTIYTNSKVDGNIPEISSEEIPLKKFTRWLESSRPGEKFCYHVGTHICGQPITRAAYEAYEDGEVVLFQKKEINKFSYWAQKISRI